MAPRRPPDILRKSHAHSAGRTRTRAKRELDAALDESIAPGDDEGALLIDLDGVVYRGDQPIEGAAAAVRWLTEQQLPYLFVTNTTSRPRAALVEKLAGLGIAASVEDILAPPDAAAAWLAERGCRRLNLLVPAATQAAFAGFEIIDVDRMSAAPAVDAVVVGDLGREWSFDRLNLAFRCLMRDPQPLLLALGMTRYWHAPDGLQLDTAPFVAALEHASGVAPTVLGKPAPAFFAAALARLGTSAGQTSMIGDDIRADVAGAQAAGLEGILVRTGKFRAGDLELGIEPDLVLESIADLPRVWSERASS
jgi:HAD superfamily hydrolase (TIGR01458 family)